MRALFFGSKIHIQKIDRLKNESSKDFFMIEIAKVLLVSGDSLHTAEAAGSKPSSPISFFLPAAFITP